MHPLSIFTPPKSLKANESICACALRLVPKGTYMVVSGARDAGFSSLSANLLTPRGHTVID